MMKYDGMIKDLRICASTFTEQCEECSHSNEHGDCYIKREDVVSALWKALYSYEDKTEKQFKEDPNLETGEWFDHRIFVQACHAECLEGVLVIPSADVAEVKHCTWLAIGNTGLASCKCGYITDRYRMFNFCPNCGADMRKDGE